VGIGKIDRKTEKCSEASDVRAERRRKIVSTSEFSSVTSYSYGRSNGGRGGSGWPYEAGSVHKGGELSDITLDRI